MADVPWQKQLWDMAQRVGTRIAALPADKREAGFQVADREMREMVIKLGIAKDVDAFVALLLQVVRETVEKIDMSGNPQGGNA